MTPSEKAKIKHDKDFYNISPEQRAEMEAEQDYACAICGLPPLPGERRLAIDHDHTDGLIRGLLCNHCNHLLGKIENLFVRYPADKFPLKNVWWWRCEVLTALVDYISTPPAVHAIGTVRTYPGRLGTKVHRKWLKKRKKGIS